MKNKFYLSGGAIAIIIGVLVAFGVFKKADAPATQNSNQNQTSEVKWVTYKNAKYAFELQYPDTWQVKEDYSTQVPVINIYKKSETAKPPFYLQTGKTAISILPQGLGTEGPQSETRVSTVTFTEPTKNPVDFLLKDGTPWGTFAFFKNKSTSKDWNEFAFIWAEVQVDNLNIKCVSKNGTAIAGECEFGIEAAESKTVRTGAINAADRAIEERILQSFKFTK